MAFLDVMLLGCVEIDHRIRCLASTQFALVNFLFPSSHVRNSRRTTCSDSRHQEYDQHGKLSKIVLANGDCLMLTPSLCRWCPISCE